MECGSRAAITARSRRRIRQRWQSASAHGQDSNECSSMKSRARTPLRVDWALSLVACDTCGHTVAGDCGAQVRVRIEQCASSVHSCAWLVHTVPSWPLRPASCYQLAADQFAMSGVGGCARQSIAGGGKLGRSIAAAAELVRSGKSMHPSFSASNAAASACATASCGSLPGARWPARTSRRILRARGG
jgi:hypothetical protein